MPDLSSRAVGAVILLAAAAWLAKVGHTVEAVGIAVAVFAYFVTPVVEAAGAGEPLASRLPSPLSAFRRELATFVILCAVFGAFVLWKHFAK